MKAEDILKLDDVSERVEVYREQSRIFVDMLRRTSSEHGRLVREAAAELHWHAHAHPHPEQHH
jgi:hypothetical protein